MNAQEFSNEFDALYNNVSSNQAPGLTEYEKSVFLTKAQNEIIKNYFTNVQGGNKYQQGICDSEKRFADFSALLSVATLNAEKKENVTTFDPRGVMFRLPDGSNPKEPKTMIIIDEAFSTAKTKDSKVTNYQVIPLQFDEYKRLMSKPSSDPLKYQAWKLMGNNEFGNGTVEIVPHWKDKGNQFNQLILKYIRKPRPIILEDLEPQGLSIEGYTDTYKIDEYIGVNTIILKDAEGNKLMAAYIANDEVPTAGNVFNTIEKKDDKYYIKFGLGAQPARASSLIGGGTSSSSTDQQIDTSSGRPVINLGGNSNNNQYTAPTTGKFDPGTLVIPGTTPGEEGDDNPSAFEPQIAELHSPTIYAEGVTDMDDFLSKLDTYTISYEVSENTENTYIEICCELAEEIHPEILQRAVELAKVHYGGQTQEIIASGQRSE